MGDSSTAVVSFAEQSPLVSPRPIAQQQSLQSKDANSFVVDVGDEVPDFNLDSQLGRISFHDIIDGKWCLLVTFASAFDPVATSDLGMLSKLAEEFEARNIFLIAVGNDTVPKYRQWIRDVEEVQTCKLKMALLADTNCAVLKSFGCARQSLGGGGGNGGSSGGELRPTALGAFLIDIDRRVRCSTRTSPVIGRNWYELLRQYDALMLSTQFRVVTPSNWGAGQDVMLHPAATAEEQRQFRFVEIRPWFRVTPYPDNS